MSALPERVKNRLVIVGKATGIAPLDLWRLQSLAVRVAVNARAKADLVAGLAKAEKAKLLRSWRKFWARPSQLPPSGLGWFLWFILAGRGWGKTRTGAQAVIEWAREMPGSLGILVGPTAALVRNVMVEGESGVLACSPRDFRPKYEPSKRRLTWPNGTVAVCYSTEKPEAIRGEQSHWFWADEVGAWRHPEYAWAMLEYCVRLEYEPTGARPRGVATTTPRPMQLIRDLVAQARATGSLTQGTSFENIASLAADWFNRLLRVCQTPLGRQEAFGELVEAVEGALWDEALLEEQRIKGSYPEVRVTVIGVDPATKGHGDEHGIVAVSKGLNGDGYLSGDFSLRGSPYEWARRTLDLYAQLKAAAIVVETNRGGDMVKHTLLSALRSGERPPKIVEVYASDGKHARAEPIASLWRAGRFWSLGVFGKLFSELCTWVPGVSTWSPNRLDAMVWAATYLFPPLPPSGGRAHSNRPQGY